MIFAALALVAAQAKVPPPPRVARPEHVQVHRVAIDEANEHAGKIVSLDIRGLSTLSLEGVTEPAGLVIIGTGRSVARIKLSPRTSALYVYDLTITGEMHGSHSVSCESQPEAVFWSDPMPDGDPAGFTYFEDCLFGGKEIHNYAVTHIGGIPGLYKDNEGVGRVAVKWHVQPKAPRKWYFSGCVFWASQEHALYFHWAHFIRIEDCIFHADGGTAVQAVMRYGRKRPGFPDNYYGNPSLSPPASGDFICINSEFRDANIWSREGSALTVVSWVQGDVYLENLTFEGSKSAIALWTDSYKGSYSRDTEGRTFAHVTDVDEFGDMDVQVHPEGVVMPVEPVYAELLGYPFNTVYANRIHVKPSSNHDREQIMMTGARRYELSNILIESHKPGLVIGAEGGGYWKFHPTEVALTKNLPDVLWWDGSGYRTVDPREPPDHWSIVRRRR